MIRPCPFCGCVGAGVCYDCTICDSCGARGPTAEGGNDALEKWNERWILVRTTSDREATELAKKGTQ